MTPLTWAGRLCVPAVVLALAAPAGAQPQPQFNPGGAFRPQPKQNPPKGEPRPNEPKKTNPVIVHPQFNTLPNFQPRRTSPPLFNPGPIFNPALSNPWMNQTTILPVGAFNNPFAPNVFNNPCNNPFAPNVFNFNNPLNNPFAPNPFVNNPFNNPFAPNPFLNNPFNNPFAWNPFNDPILAQFPNAIVGCYGPVVSHTPPLAIRQPGLFLWRGPDLEVNPWSGTVYRPQTGIARTADGSLFFRVPGTGLPTPTGAYAPGTGLYYNPQGGTFLNPSSGVISRPGATNVFIPWIPR